MSEPITLLTETNFPREVQVSFISKHFPHKTPTTPFAVPSDITRFGLSEIVNHLLHDALNGEIVPFEFLVEYREGKKVFLRTSLKKFFTKIQKYPVCIHTYIYIYIYIGFL
jgi:ribosome biogenesis protein YTM1